jgi:hypothetical protein
MFDELAQLVELALLAEFILLLDVVLYFWLSGPCL